MAPDFDWNEDKNQLLVEQRGISFERVISAIERGGLVDVLEHPDQERYEGQMIYVVDIEQYIYLVPFVTRSDGSPRFLKTIIPSRKATRNYRKRRSS
ncbi:MAG: BrnT family toxin [Gemmatimonadota bacterium]|nr:BrnT family toxin [Gemmatimonadota bacterium]